MQKTVYIYSKLKFGDNITNIFLVAVTEGRNFTLATAKYSKYNAWSIYFSFHCHILKLICHKMGLVARKPVFGGLRTTKAQTSLRIRAVWSAPLLFALFWKHHIQAYYKRNLKYQASLCSWGEWLSLALSQTLEDRFSYDEAQMIITLHVL